MFTFTKSLKGRFAAYFVLAIAISLVLSGLISVGLMQRYINHKTISDLTEQAQALSSQIESDGLPTRRYFVDLERISDTRAFIIPYGEQFLSRIPHGVRGDEVELSTRTFPFINWDLLNRGGTQAAETEIPGSEQKAAVVASGFRVNDELIGAVVLARPLESLQSWPPLAGWFLVAAVVSLVVSFLMAFLLARRLSRPLHEITQAASAVAEGDFSHAVSVHSQDEIGRLADAFRYMSDEVQKSQEQQREFVINVSHELKTPLTSIAGHAQALRDGVASDAEDVAKSFEVIDAETKRLSRLIEDLLSLAKADAREFGLKSATVPLKETLAAVKAGFAWQAESADVSLEVESPSGMTITTDADRLRQILSNLVQNALAHTTAGGKVKMTGRADGSGRVAIEVSDTGEGIEEADLPYVFDRFHRGKSNESNARSAGLGLGLSISRELARAMGGDISVSSQPGEGSTFTLTLPA